MTTRSPFKADWGLTQGRVAPASWSPPPHGSYVLCLGRDEAGRIYQLCAHDDVDLADHIMAQQVAELDGVKLLRYRLRIIEPSSMPAGVAWQFRLRAKLTGGVVLDAKELLLESGGATRTFADLALNVSKASPAPDTYDVEAQLSLLNSLGGAEIVEAALPTVYLDNLILDDASGSRMVLVNRAPEPDAVAIPVDTEAVLDLVDTDVDGVDWTKTFLHLSGSGGPAGSWGPTLVWNDGFESGWTGSSSAPAADTLRLSFKRAGEDWGSEETVTVHVMSETVGGAATLDQSYVFRCADVIAPTLLLAQARGLRTVRVTFSEAVRQVSASGATDALNPANYALSRQTTPAVEVVVESVASADGANVVDVLADDDLSPGATYRVTVENVIDLSGNAISAPLSLDFTAAVPPQPLGRRFELLYKVPGLNRNEDITGDLAKVVQCLQEIVDLLLYRIDIWTDIFDIDRSPEAFLDVLLASFGNPFTFDLAAIDKRRLLAVLVNMYQQKGTDVGVVNAIRFFLGLEVTVETVLGRTWRLGKPGVIFNKLGTARLGPATSRPRFSFDIITTIALTETQRAQLRRIANYMKPAHTHLREIVEPAAPAPAPNHLVLGLSRLDANWRLH